MLGHKETQIYDLLNLSLLINWLQEVTQEIVQQIMPAEPTSNYTLLFSIHKLAFFSLFSFLLVEKFDFTIFTLSDHNNILLIIFILNAQACLPVFADQGVALIYNMQVQVNRRWQTFHEL